MSSKRPLFGRVGGKFKLRKQIVDNYFYPDYENMTYVEPFIGGGSIYFYKKPSKLEVINDKDKCVTDVFKLFQKYDGKDIEDVINRDWNKEDFEKIKSSKPTNDFDSGIKELLLSKLSFLSLKRQYSPSKNKLSLDIKNKYKDRLKDTIILNEDFKDVVKKYDSKNTFFYLDPPYEKSKGLYTYFNLPIKDIYDVLKNIKGKFLMSYNDSEDAKILFKDYYINYINAKYAEGTKGGHTKKKKEILISNYDPKKPLVGGGINLKAKLKGFGDEIKQVEEDPLDDLELKNLLGNPRILKYDELSKYRSLEELLPKKRDYIILLYLDAPNKGHWTCIIRNNNDVYFFCSYGSKVDEPLSWVPITIRMKLRVCVPFLTRLFNNTSLNTYYSPVKYQQERDDVNTCGRYCVLLIKKFQEEQDYDLDKFYEYLTSIKNKFKLSYDEVVSTLIDE
jgi:DNA adenine methylase